MTTTVSSQPRVDRRVLRTRKAIHTAFIELLAEVDFDKITITALAKRADIDRKTFILTTHQQKIFLRTT